MVNEEMAIIICIPINVTHGAMHLSGSAGMNDIFEHGIKLVLQGSIWGGCTCHAHMTEWTTVLNER